MSDGAASAIIVVVAAVIVIGGVAQLISYRPTITLCVIGAAALGLFIWYEVKHPIKDWQQKLEHQRQQRAARHEIELKYQEQDRRLRDRFDQG
jgi:ABC-type bacteriocin/lantibiotic exporter with double-glycine peptidase domain